MKEIFQQFSLSNIFTLAQLNFSDRWGELVDVRLMRDRKTGKSRGFAFVAYEDQRSTNLAVDNFNGAEVK